MSGLSLGVCRSGAGRRARQQVEWQRRLVLPSAEGYVACSCGFTIWLWWLMAGGLTAAWLL